MKKKRASKKLKPEPDIMERTRATVGLLNSAGYNGRKDAQMFAFLSIFHPEMSFEKKRRMSSAVKE